MISTMQRCDGHRAKAAEALGIGLRTLSGKLRTYGYAPREKDFAKASLTEQSAKSAASKLRILPVDDFTNRPDITFCISRKGAKSQKTAFTSRISAFA